MRFLINSLFALKGYAFGTPKWQQLYGRFEWYEGVTKDPPFLPEARELIEQLLADKRRVYRRFSGKSCFWKPIG